MSPFMAAPSDDFGEERPGQFRGSRQHRPSDSGCFSDHKRHTGRKEQPRAKSRVTVYGDEPEVDDRTRRIDLAKDLLDFLYGRNIEFDLRVANGQQVVNVRIPLDSHKTSPSVGACRGSREPTEGEARKGHSDESADRWRPELRDKSTVTFGEKGDSLLEQYKKVSVALRELRRIVEESRSSASQPVESYSNHEFAEVSSGGHGEVGAAERECVAAFSVRLEKLFERFEVLFGEFNQLFFEFKHQSSPSVGSSGDSSEPTEGEARKGHSDESADVQQPWPNVGYVNLEWKGDSFVRELKRRFGENRDDGKGMP